MYLQSGTLLQDGEYKIIRFIKSGGFGCTYEAYQKSLDRRVAIKEFFWQDYCSRDSHTGRVTISAESHQHNFDKLRSKFIDEAKVLSRIIHPGIVRVSAVFEENGTAYYVMDYVDGCSLADKVSRDGAIDEQEALRYIRDTALTLQYIHQNNRLHLDIKPSNIMLDRDGKIILIDFGVSKQYDEKGSNSTALMGYSKCYSPIEQLGSDVKTFLPATDIYSLGATLYHLLTGVTPPVASDIIRGLPTDILSSRNISNNTIHAIQCAMRVDKEERPQSIADFLHMLDGKASGDNSDDSTCFIVDDTPQQQIQQEPQQATQSQPKRVSQSIIIVAVIGILLGAVAVVGAMRGCEDNQTERIVQKETTILESGKEQTDVYQVGDYYNHHGLVGVVFEVSNDGCHGKVVSMDETRDRWCTVAQFSEEIVVGASSTTDGKYNTDMIAAQGLSNYPAAKWCRDKGSQWYLPAEEELLVIYRNIDKINNTLSQNGGTEIKTKSYWSSTERNVYFPRRVRMSDGYTFNREKPSNFYVRAVSAF